MKRSLRFTPTAVEQLERLKTEPSSKEVLKQVRKTLGYLETDLRSKSLQTHKHEALTRRYGREIFEAYVQNQAPGAYRVFWHYGRDEVEGKDNRVPVITMIAIIKAQFLFFKRRPQTGKSRPGLEAAYAEMANEKRREQEAIDWAETNLPDL